MNDFIFGNNIISNKPSEEKNIDVAGWMRFLREHSGLLVLCAFRQGSKNTFQTTLQDLEGEEKESLLHLLEIDGENLPHSSTVDHALSNIHYEEFKEILLSYFDQLQKKKFFYNHRELL